ncbi:hypothetical protein SAMN04488003_12729 [Loktanella fryxellensis]|uniref:Uncharacterized protein n=2 Tax=Loktanella fryxellensis TaxID=245187 RepID=A0A1H8IR87_9RHOB|nr:hypothetical protein SAMN04488003_12729 [Loktanella fryxellensis]
MQQFLTDNPSLLATGLDLILAMAALALTWAATRVGKRAGVQVEQTHLDRINAAVRHVVVEAMADGRTDLSEIARIAGVYLRAHLPDAVNAMQPTPKVIRTVAAAHLATVPDIAALRTPPPLDGRS